MPGPLPCSYYCRELHSRLPKSYSSDMPIIPGQSPLIVLFSPVPVLLQRLFRIFEALEHFVTGNMEPVFVWRVGALLAHCGLDSSETRPGLAPQTGLV